ncbi:hypothetical protein Nepgr_013817 [Nepenthes gracilis]|uniref:Cyclic nucleotide-binding domain-containing protein n=1 Tax=Nepenthes gracilis TaxID=150966 RepID=A0AAD3SJU9_NEPGR|nr:hypothetical protein Nepgr_013817 [Nepenthes gracilis]
MACNFVLNRSPAKSTVGGYLADDNWILTRKKSHQSLSMALNFKTVRVEDDWNKLEGLDKVLSEDYEKAKNKHMIIDPRGSNASRWNKLFLAVSIVSLLIDPIFFMVPQARPEFCIQNEITVQVILTITRSIADVFYLINIAVQFRTAYVAPSSRVFGRGELVIDPWKIAFRYLRFGFWVDLIAALPLPQVFVWVILPKIRDIMVSESKAALRFIIIIQFIYRLVLAYPLSLQIAKETGIMWKTAWFNAAYNLLFVILASDIAGTSWYLLGIQRQEECWGSACNQNSTYCQIGFFECSMINNQDRNAWVTSSNISTLCQPSDGFYQFGIYGEAVVNTVYLAFFFNRFFYSLWWGLKTLCSLGQNLTSSIHVGENIFTMLVVTLGLINYALLVGNMQSYLESATARLEEWRLKRNDTEKWMHHRQLPEDLRQCIRKYDRYKWVTTRGVDEESLLRRLPTDLQRQIKRHLCLGLLRRVPLFNQMDDRMLDAISERLSPTLCTEGTLVISEGDPLNEMLFIVRGSLHSYTTNGGRAGFFNSTRIGFGDFCGEELLTWALTPPPNGILPVSTRTVKALSDVEAFSLEAGDLKFVAQQFYKLGSREMKHTFHFYSQQWRTWAACYIQAAWRRHKKRRLLGELVAREESSRLPTYTPNADLYEEMDVFVPRPGSGMAVYAARLMADIRRGSSNRFGPDSYNAICSL